MDSDDNDIQIVSHFFRSPNKSEEEQEDEKPFDLFASIEEWFADYQDVENKEKEEDEDDIKI